MDLICQKESLKQLQTLAQSKARSILIDGPKGCGKTYLAQKYASMLKADDFQSIPSTVSEIRDAVESCFGLQSPIVLCIENLDAGVVGASYTLLKFLEEPYQNTYIVVTCRNIRKIPDTIISRSSEISTNPPTTEDIKSYCKIKYPQSYERIYKKEPLVMCIKTFADIDILSSLSEDKLDYIINTRNLHIKTDPVSNTVWSLGHFQDNTECPIDIVVKYLALVSQSQFVQQCAIECEQEFTRSIIPKHQALTKFVMDLKYIEW